MRIRRFFRILKRTGMKQVLISFIIVFFIPAAIILFVEPDITTYRDALWYTFVSSTSIGYGDICVQTHVGRIITVIITIYEIIVAAMIPGVVVANYTEYIKERESDTITTFLDKLEHLPELSTKELESISERIKKFNR